MEQNLRRHPPSALWFLPLCWCLCLTHTHNLLQFLFVSSSTTTSLDSLHHIYLSLFPDLCSWSSLSVYKPVHLLSFGHGWLLLTQASTDVVWDSHWCLFFGKCYTDALPNTTLSIYLGTGTDVTGLQPLWLDSNFNCVVSCLFCCWSPLISYQGPCSRWNNRQQWNWVQSCYWKTVLWHICGASFPWKAADQSQPGCWVQTLSEWKHLPSASLTGWELL